MLSIQIKSLLDKGFPNLSYKLAPPEVPVHGHLATNIAFVMGKTRGIPPMKAAEYVKEFLTHTAPKDLIAKIDIAQPGFINIWFASEAIQKEFGNIAKNKNWGKSNVGKSQKVIVEYSSPNIAKPMHVGHFRSTIIGDAIANIHEFLGYKTIRWNYIGDWGTPHGKIIAAYKMLKGDLIIPPGDFSLMVTINAILEQNGKEIRENLNQTIDRDLEIKPIETMVLLYQAFTMASKNIPLMEKTAQEEFNKLEKGDKKNRKLWARFKAESLEEFNKMYKKLGVKFDITLGESFYEKDLREIIAFLMHEEIAIESEGAIIIPLDDLGLPPAMIQKSDGATLYLTRDIANIIYRLKKYKPAKIIYEIGSEQELHFKQLFAIAKADFMPELKAAKTTELMHVGHGLVLGEDGKKLSTRAGKTIFMEEVIEEAIEKTRKIIDEKNRALSETEKQKIAKVVAIGALKYNDLSQNRMSNITFDWDKMLSFEGDSGPYLQYSYARLKSILRKSGSKNYKLQTKNLSSALELEIILKLDRFPEVIAKVGREYYPNELAQYLYDLSKSINHFYQSERVRDSEPGIREARLALISTSASVLKTGLSLLGIETLEKM